MKNAEIKYNRKAIYTGRRLGAKGFSHRFELLPSRKEMFFKGVTGVHIGFTYECAASHIRKRPARIIEAERIDNPDWEAQDALVKERAQETSAFKKLSALSRPNLQAAIEALLPLIKNVGHYDITKLVNFLVNQAIEARDKKRKKKKWEVL
jgi:hypothetical protein